MATATSVLVPAVQANRGAVEYGVVVVAVVAIQAFTFITQPRITVNGGRGYDGATYYRMAEQLAEGHPPHEVSRFARRVGTPFLAALADPGQLIDGFEIVNVCAAFTSTLLLLGWLRRYLPDPGLRIALVIVYATHWLQLVRFTFFYPVLVDACAQAFCFAGLHCIAWYEKKPGRWPLVAVAAISAAGVCFREIVLLVPLAFLFARNPRIGLDRHFPYIQITNAPRIHELIPLALAGAALALIGSFVLATDPEFSAANHLLDRALSRSPLTYLLGWMVAFAPGLFLVLFDWRRALDFVACHTWMLVFMAGVALVGWAGSLESERHALNWSAPIVYVLIGHAIQRCHLSSRPAALAAVAVIAQTLVNRLFWTIPQPAADYFDHDPTIVLTPLGSSATYLHLFPNEMPRMLAWVTFVEYAALGGLIVMLMWLRPSRSVPEKPLRRHIRVRLPQRPALTSFSVAASLRLPGIAGTLRALGGRAGAIAVLAWRAHRRKQAENGEVTRASGP